MSYPSASLVLASDLDTVENGAGDHLVNVLDLLRRRKNPAIFICYRRHGEGAGFGGRVADKLVSHFGPHQCFRDVENIETGADFVESISKAIAVCEVLVVVIAPDWVTQEDASNRPRIEDPKDFVRLEVSAALQRNIRVMPVLVGGARVPDEDNLPDDLKALPRRQAHELTDSRWNYDTDRLIEAIESIGIKGRSPAQQEAFKQKVKLGAAVLATFAVVSLGLVQMYRFGSAFTETEKAPQTTLQEDEPDPSQLEAELRAEQERNRALEAERDRARLEAELEAEKAKRREAERERTETRPPASSIPNIAGIWRDSNSQSNGGQITQNGSRFDFSRWGVLPNGVRFESVGTGTISAGRFTSQYNATYQTGFISAGSCSGTISSNGTRMDMTCTDNVLGVFPVTSFRQ